MRVKIIQHGTLSILSEEPRADPRENHEWKTALGVDGASNVILVEGSDYKLLVDTGYGYESDSSEVNRERNRLNLEWHLRQHGLHFRDLTDVFLTHAHYDHLGNLYLFPQAHIHAYEGLAAWGNWEDVNGVPDGAEFLPGVRVLATPGHTRTHGSLIIDDEIALAGDAIVDYSYFRDDSVWHFNADFYGLEAARESIRKLTEQARLIVPGHGMPFWVSS